MSNQIQVEVTKDGNQVDESTKSKIKSAFSLLSILAFFATFTLMLVSAFLRGFVLYKFYGWFIMETFHAPAITLAQTFGVMIFITFLLKRSSSRTKKKDKLTYTILVIDYVKSFINIPLSLLVGYLVHILL